MSTTSSASSLSASVQSLKSSLQLLDSSISILDQGISDFPRLSTVLSSTRHFELTPSPSLALAQHSLATELAPAITTLLTRAETHLDRLERREQALRAKAELQAGRLGQRGTGGGAAGGRTTPGGGRAGGLGGGAGGLGNGGGGEGGKEAKLRMLKQKKERLGYAVERLQLQSQQRQRQLRMSVSYAGQDFQ
ncbi:hypothetical protein VF21_03825 [Pseudogymnoascus sp. 05NY08]|nr:hypothetical protein VF21_03825 [Pseudogymnoascus sp. 05NY08]